MIPAVKNISRPTVALLLVLCLSPVVTAYQPAGVQDPGKTPNAVLLTSAIMGRAVAATLDSRTILKSSDGLVKDALIPGQASIDLAGASVSFLSEFLDRFGQCAEQKAIFTRAPPRI